VDGIVTAAQSQRFIVNGVEVVYPLGLVEGLPSGVIEIGQRVSVAGNHHTADGALVAARIVRHDLSPLSPEAVVAGTIFIEADRVLVSGHGVTVSPETKVAGRLVSGSYVRVTGVQSGQMLDATHVLVLGSGPEFWHFGSVEAVDIAARKFKVFGIDFSLNEWTRISRAGTSLSLNDVAVGDRVNVMAYENDFVSGVYLDNWMYDPRVDLVEGEYFRDLPSPLQFILDGVADRVVQVTPGARFFYDWRSVTPEMQGHSGWRCAPVEVSAERFWLLAAQPRPPDMAYVQASGRFESGIFMASSVALCRSGGLPP
jgi:hypothetical protein